MTAHWHDRGATPEEDREIGCFETGVITEVHKSDRYFSYSHYCDWEGWTG